MCEVKSKGKKPRTNPPKKIQWLAMKWNGLWWTPSNVERKNATHPIDKIAN
jgi:hypothetical protein